MFKLYWLTLWNVSTDVLNKRCKARTLISTLLLVLSAVLSACHNSSDIRYTPPTEPELPQAENPAVEGPITTGGAADCCTANFFGIEIDLRDLDYIPGSPFYTFQ